MGQPVAVASTACTTVALAGALVLLAASVGHAWAFDRLRATLVVQRLVPYHLHRVVAVGLVLVEFGVGGAAPVSVVARHALARPVLYGEAVVYFAFLGYLTTLKGTRPGAPCGCFHGDGPVGAPALCRAALFAAGATAAAILPGGPATNVSVLVAFPSAVLLAVLVRAVPALTGGPVVSWRN